MWWYGAKRVRHRRSATSEGWPHSRCGDTEPRELDTEDQQQVKVDRTRDVVIWSQESWTQKISNKWRLTALEMWCWRLTALEMWWYGAKRVGHRRSATSEGWPHSRCGDTEPRELDSATSEGWPHSRCGDTEPRELDTEDQQQVKVDCTRDVVIRSQES